MVVDFGNLSSGHIYHMMTQTIIPRPIAWVLTENDNQTYNLAPFSYFSAISSNPPLVMISVGKKPNGEPKDTRSNIERHKKLVIHIPSSTQAQEVTTTALPLAYGESEIDHIQQKLVSQDGWSLPRLVSAPVAFYGELYEMHELGANKQQAVIYARLHSMYVDDKSVAVDGDKSRLLAESIDPLGRLGAQEYASLGRVFKK